MSNTEMLKEICTQLRRTADLIEKFVGQATVNSDEAFFQGELTDSPNRKDTSDSVGVLVVKDGKILVGTRDNDFGKGLICGPGGHIENGETSEQAAVRETQEEFGITPKELVSIGRGPIEADTGLSPHIFLCTDYEGEIKCVDGEIRDPRFMSHEEIDSAFDMLFKPFADSVLLFFSTLLVDEINSDGGEGSGNFGHSGVEGQVGGSAPSDTAATKSDNHIKMKRPTQEEIGEAFSDLDGLFGELYSKYMPKLSEAEEAGDKEAAKKIRDDWNKENYTRRATALKRLGTYMEDGYYVSERDLTSPISDVYSPVRINQNVGCHDIQPITSGSSRDNVPALYVSESWVKISKEEAKEKVSNYAEKLGYDVTFGGLSGSDEQIIKTYTYAPAVSSAMRKGESTEQGDKLKKIMDNTASPERKVYRGVTGDFASKISNLKVGDTFTDKGFMSTSSEKEVANKFAGESGVTMTINVPSGFGKSMAISSYSMKPEEAEILLNAGSTLRIKSNNGKEIECDVIDT